VLIVVALGGNALLRRGEPTDAETQRRNVAVAADALAELAQEHTLVITHGNGPQVGLLALESGTSGAGEPYPLDVLGAESEGMIGYLLEQGLRERMPQCQSATLLTQVIVDAEDPAFAHPSKPVGAVYDRESAQRIAAERGWSVAPDGSGYRRVVPSPEPREIVELETIKLLVDAGVLVICAGGGGVPVIADGDGVLRGVQAVIDKDHSAALLARELGADALLLLTDVSCVQRDYGSEHARPIRSFVAGELDPSEFAEGSMRPKIEAASDFVASTGGLAAIGGLGEAADVLAGRSGTRVLARRSGLDTERAIDDLRRRAERLPGEERLIRRLARRATKPLMGRRPEDREPRQSAR